MRLWHAALAFLLIWFPSIAQAHRLDEYLQAATLSIDHSELMLKLRLTPGVSVAPAVLAAIDTDKDGTFSPTEQQGYAERVRDDLALTMDGAPVALKPVSAAFPGPSEIKAGLGDITLVFSVAIHSTAGHHLLTLVNRHENRIAVYLVNTLQPTDPEISVLSQSRSYDQSSYSLGFSTASIPGATGQNKPEPEKNDAIAVVTTFFCHGIVHILTGYDHLLFIAAMVFAATSLWDLVKVVTAFTLAHSLTLGLATFGLIHLDSRIVEPLISASIVFVAMQNIFWPTASSGAGRLAAFCFGLVHGLGFASGLLQIMHAMPFDVALLALLGFSLGIEVGNQLVLLPLFGALRWLRRASDDAKTPNRIFRQMQIFGSATIALGGVYFLCVALASLS